MYCACVTVCVFVSKHMCVYNNYVNICVCLCVFEYVSVITMCISVCVCYKLEEEENRGPVVAAVKTGPV